MTAVPAQDRVADQRLLPAHLPREPQLEEVAEAAVEVAEIAPVVVSKEQQLRIEAKSLRHLMTHKPRNPFCAACQRAKMQSKPARSK